MSNPAITYITKNKWNKVATNVTKGTIHRISETPSMYLQSYRETGGAAPTSFTEAVPMFSKYPNEEEISATSAIDVYVSCRRRNGIVRVDI